MQYTGLKDKNGKDIYEGDILKEDGCLLLRSACYGKNACFYLSGNPYSGGDIMTSSIKPNEDKTNFIYYLEKMEVVGNIYENPELSR